MSQTDPQIQKVVDARGLYLGYVVTSAGRLVISYPRDVVRFLPPPPAPPEVKVLTPDQIAARDNLPRRSRLFKSGFVLCPKCANYVPTTANELQIVICDECSQRILAFGYSIAF